VTAYGGVFGPEIPTVSVSDVARQLEAGWTLLDVRTDQEWAAGRMPGALHIPMDQLMRRLDEVGDQVICVCAVGGRSARVTQFLNSRGRDAVNLEGGIYAWVDAGLPVETG
jgi:rhodanese-related sulfurtransferase